MLLDARLYEDPAEAPDTGGGLPWRSPMTIPIVALSTGPEGQRDLSG